MNTTTKIHVAAALAGLVSLSGCSLLFRAAKGELTPMGVTQASYGTVSSLTSRVSSETDPQQFSKAFADLTSVYMYKCMENPTMVPEAGKQELREQAGDGLVQAMLARVAKYGVDDPVLATADVAGLSGKLGKCDEGKRSAQDAGGKFTQALALATADGRAEHVKTTAQGLDASLEQALGAGDAQVLEWARNTCGSVLPQWGYCMPRAAEGFYSKGRMDGLANALLSQGDAAKALLPGLGAKVGKDQLVGEVKTFMTSGKATGVSTGGLDHMATFLRENGGWGSCEDRQGMLKASLLGEGSAASQWAIARIVEDKCRNLDDEIIKAMGSDQPWVRQAAAWAVGELKIQKAKKHVDRLRYSDPYMDEGCWCHPVRDEAANAFNKLELEGG